ncbi:MAG: pitrilysin family protein [Verrucomicrobiota bacterium]
MTTYHHFELPSGTRVRVAEMPWMESVSAGVWAGVGGRHDPARLSGLAHFAEHMVFQGTGRRTARRLNTEVESVGGSMDAYTSEDHTAFFVRGPAEHFARFSDVLFDLYQHSVFNPDTVKKEREVIAEEIAMYREQPNQHVEDLLCRTVWPKHPLGLPIAGTEKSLERIHAEALRDHARKYFGAGNSVISVAGRIEAKEVRELLTKILPKGLPSDVRPPGRPFKLKAARRPSVVSETRELDQIQVALAFHAPGRKSRALPALRLLNVILGENTSSRLWSELREKRGLCYDSGSDLTSLEDTGLLHIYAGVDPDKLDRVFDVIFKTLHGLAEKAVSPGALKAAVEFSIGSSRMAMESTSHQMTMMAESELLYGHRIDMEAMHARLRAVTPEQVRKVAAEVFLPGRLTVALVGPETDHALVGSAAAKWL